jgi:hypothetical protein
MKSYSTTISVNSTADEAMEKISQVDKWWAKKVNGSAEKLNDRFTADFGSTFVDFQIVEFVPSKKVVWQVTDCNLEWIKTKKEWNGTEVVFELSPKKNSTEITFTHVGLVPTFECYSDCEVGWNEHIGESLLAFINEGKGMPV